MSHTPSSRPMPPELLSEISQRTEGQELVQVWELLALADPVEGSPEASRVWERISAEISHGRPILTPSQPISVLTPPVPTRSIVRSQPRWRQAAPWALAATLTVAVGLSVWQSRPVTHEAPLGQQLVVQLPDGSTAELNAGSSVRYARGFRRLAGLARGDRGVTLDGEAYFTVVRQDRPFTVTTDEARVTVLGTEFLVRAHREELDGTRVAVQSGRVRVSANRAEAEAAVELGAGQGTFVARNAQKPDSVQEVGVDRLAGWRRGGFWLVDQPLSAIFRELERRYAVDIRLRDVVVGDERLMVYYPERPSIETILSDLCTTRGLRYSRTSRGFDISPQAERPVTP
jgi:ferric-dicitrate binding protein FerR (iron transport regulator)